MATASTKTERPLTAKAWAELGRFLPASEPTYELAAGNLGEARRLADAMESMASETGLLPEQIWDTDRNSRQNLYRRSAQRIGSAAGMGPCRACQASSLNR